MSMPPSCPPVRHNSVQHLFEATGGDKLPTQEKLFTLVVSLSPSNSKILFGKKLRGFGVGLYNGFGGKPDGPDEAMDECACREMFEESKISVPRDLMMPAGVLTFTGLSPYTMIIHLFRVNLDALSICRPERTEEMVPEFFDISAIPYDEM